MAQQQYDPKTIGEKLFTDLVEVTQYNQKLQALPAEQKLVDVSNLKADGSGIKKIKRNKTQKTSKKSSDALAILVSNNWAAYDVATRSLAAAKPEWLQVAQQANGDFLNKFGQLVYVKPAKKEKQKGPSRREKKLQKDFDKAKDQKANLDYIYIDPAVIGMTRVRSPGITVAPIVPTIPGSDVGKPLARIPVTLLTEQQIVNYGQRMPSPTFSKQLDPVSYDTHENVVDYLTKIQSMGEQAAQNEYSKLPQQDKYTLDRTLADLVRRVRGLDGKSNEEIQKWYTLQSPATQRWYAAYRQAEPEQKYREQQRIAAGQQNLSFIPPSSPAKFGPVIPSEKFFGQQANRFQQNPTYLPTLQPSSPRQTGGFQQNVTNLPTLQPSSPRQIGGFQQNVTNLPTFGGTTGQIIPNATVFQPGRISLPASLSSSSGSSSGNGGSFPFGSNRSGSNSQSASGSGSNPQRVGLFGSGLEGRVPQGGSLPTMGNIRTTLSSSGNSSP